jgi:hypothetical protein
LVPMTSMTSTTETANRRWWMHLLDPAATNKEGGGDDGSNDTPSLMLLLSLGIVLDTTSEGPHSLFVPIVTQFFVPIKPKYT